MQLTAKNGASLSIVRSTFATLPWPGIYVYNVTRNEPRISKSFIRLGCNHSFYEFLTFRGVTIPALDSNFCLLEESKSDSDSSKKGIRYEAL